MFVLYAYKVCVWQRHTGESDDELPAEEEELVALPPAASVQGHLNQADPEPVVKKRKWKAKVVTSVAPASKRLTWRKTWLQRKKL